MKLASLILTLAIVVGQLFKIPFFGQGGLTLLDITVIFLSLYGLYQTKFHLKNPPIFIKLALCFIAEAFVFLIFTPLHLDILEFFVSGFYIVRLIFYILIAWIIYSGGLKNLGKQTNEVLIYSGVFLAILGLTQFLLLPDLGFLKKEGWDPHYFRTVSTFLDPNFAGAYFVLTFTLLIQKFSKAEKKNILIFALIFMALLTTFSRSSYLMFFISGLTLAWLKKSRTLFLTIGVLFIFLLVAFQIYTKLVAEPRNIERDKSASFRLNTWQQGLTIFQYSPFLGVGYNSYRFALSEYHLADSQFISSHGGSSNDSSLLFVAATTGIFGLITYLLFIISMLKFAYKNNFIFFAGMIGLLVHSFFANSLFYPFILIWIMLKVSSNPRG